MIYMPFGACTLLVSLRSRIVTITRSCELTAITFGLQYSEYAGKGGESIPSISVVFFSLDTGFIDRLVSRLSVLVSEGSMIEV
ncbi:hypothetical protein BKA82DRAFT_991649 [Pisolithus tinctorius]|uniref:Uncharacterized protein n=1 Tax=Pisolithus tinctorius Marx 270 TaxID=870435 RepID=A0A0C3PYV5_PISTI|nr:hypothetical protein BKA82DRAFT_991649 [Pisolithus tinctorius]KIO14906.1 hypothetical protein M404DRAFT_991649 [Pisolithus tinctorius Marx 270]